jgi:hypothetical protein
MAEPVVMKGTILIPVVLALVAVLIGAECVRAGVGYYDDTTGSLSEAANSTDLVAAELDPAFVRKLALRSRAPYARAHPLTVPPRG